MTTLLFESLVFALLFSHSSGHPQFRMKIPNGYSVPNPCDPMNIWPGVGHMNSQGGGPRNPFGLAFFGNGFVWNRTLCEKDSDGDGWTNGQELGDPNCTWTEGSNASSPSLSHPGICEPIGSPRCATMNSWLMNCTSGKLICPAINNPGVKNYTMTFSQTPVPPMETTYICQRFNLPNDSVYDIIAIEPVVDKSAILHHMLLYGCSSEPTDYPENKSVICGMVSYEKCLSLIGAWTVGVPGQCVYSQFGFRIGVGGFQYVMLQLHWNNPQKRMDLIDSSGMRIYYTSELRPNRGEIAIIGQKFLAIPPGQPKVEYMGTCAAVCTQKLPFSVYITTALLHMHYLGRSGDILLMRNGQLLQTVIEVEDYDYNLPKLVDLANPIQLRPGDEIQVRCVYNSTLKEMTTYYGEATSDEMCFGFFAYYPALPDLAFCGQWKTINVCSNPDSFHFGSCNLPDAMTLLYLLPNVCMESCSDDVCAVFFNGLYATGCYNYPDVVYFLQAFMPAYSSVFAKCAAVNPPPKPTTTQNPVDSAQGQNVVHGAGFLSALIACVIYHFRSMA